MSAVTTIRRGGLTAKVDSQGAQLSSLALDGVEYLWQADPRWWAKHNPVLFPAVGAPRCKPQTCSKGECNVPKHGFARDYEHRLVGVSDDGASVTYELSDTPETRALYPYAFKLNMTYALTGPATLTQTFRVENTGEDPMPFSVGGHPAFNVPVPAPEAAGESFEDYDLHFMRAWTCDSPKMVEGGLMSYADPFHVLRDSDVLPITRGMFDFDTVVLRDVPDSTITMTGRKSGRGVRIDFAGFDFVGIWSAQPDAPFVAIEPWTGHAALDTEDGVMEHKDNVTILAPGRVVEYAYSITLL